MITMKSPLLKHNAPGADIKPARKIPPATANQSVAVPEPAKILTQIHFFGGWA